MSTGNLLPSVFAKDLFNDHEVVYLKDNIYARGSRYDSYDHKDGEAVGGYYYTWRYYNKDFNDLREILEPKLRSVIGRDLIIDHSHILHSVNPYSLHTDYEQTHGVTNSKIKPAYTIIIPLDSFDSKTFVFNQHSEDKSGNLDRSKVLQDCVDMETREKHLSHINSKYLDYVSIKETFSWTKGALYACDRRYVHCSDNYQNNGQTSKHGIIMWTSVHI